MRYLSLLLMFFVSGTLLAGDFDNIKKDDDAFKRLMMSVDVKEDPKDSNKLVFTVKMKASNLGTVSLIIEDKSKTLKTEVNGDMAVVTFETENSGLEKSNLFFSYPNGSMCPPSYYLGLRQFIL